MKSKPNRRKARASKGLRTAAEAAKWLEDNGMSQAEFARIHELPRMAVVDALRGRSKCLRGANHAAAVALGMKSPAAEPILVAGRKGR